MSNFAAVDLQVNGYAGVDFNSDGLTADEVARACRLMQRHGVTRFLPTIITAELDRMCRRLSTMRNLAERVPIAREMVAGLHIEGPFLNEQAGFVGAHPAAAVRPATPKAAERLLEAGGPLVKIVTLAPERDERFRVTRFLSERGILVSAGHCDASLDQLEGAVEAGLRMFTHLGNGCPMRMHRHDNIVQRVLSLRQPLWIGLIADGAHLPSPALGNYLRCAGPERCFVVTDAIAAAGLGPGTYSLGDQTVEIGDDLVPWSEEGNHFVGSAATMERMICHLREEVGLTDRQIERLVAINPARALAGEMPPARERTCP